MFAAERRRRVLQPGTPFPLADAPRPPPCGRWIAGCGASRHRAFIVVLMVSVAGAIVWLSRRTFIATALTIWTVSGFVWSERRWYQRLQPDDSSPALLQCLDDRHRTSRTPAIRTLPPHVPVARARIVVPDKGQDRYPPYRLKVDAAPDQVRIERLPSGANAALTDDALCRTPLLTARLIPK
jgi:hypothetical protein